MTVKTKVNGGSAVAPTYPRLARGTKSGSIYLLTAPKTGVIVHLGEKPYKAKHKLGYTSAKLIERDMTPFSGSVEVSA